METPRLILIEGGREASDALFQRLIAQPWSFEHDEFERVIESFGDRLTRAEIFDLTTERLRRVELSDKLEQHALLAVVTGDLAEGARLTKVLERRNALQLRVVSSATDGPTVPPRSV